VRRVRRHGERLSFPLWRVLGIVNAMPPAAGASAFVTLSSPVAGGSHRERLNFPCGRVLFGIVKPKLAFELSRGWCAGAVGGEERGEGRRER